MAHSDPEMQDKVRRLLIEKIDFHNKIEFHKHYERGVELMFEARSVWPEKEHFLKIFEAIYLDLANNVLPIMYKDAQKDWNRHEDYLDELLNFVTEWSVHFTFWDKANYQEYLAEVNRFR